MFLDFIALGTEQAGKSTLIETITKCAIFPRERARGERMCTKMPVRLCMVESETEEPAVVRWRDETWTLDKKEILAKVTEIMSGLPKAQILTEELVIIIRSPGIGDLEFVDLPGIREYGTGGASNSEESAKVSVA